MIAVRKNWLCQMISEKTDAELIDLLKEINSYRDTGILEGELLRGLEKSVSETVTHTRGGEMFRTVEDAVLFEMSRRYANLIESEEDEAHVEDYSNLKHGDVIYYADAEDGKGVERGIIDSVNYQPDRSDLPHDLFVEFEGDYDGFDGDILGVNLFRSKRNAEIVAAGGKPNLGCSCCAGDEAVAWIDEQNNAFVSDVDREMLVTAHDHSIRYKVKYCPVCGKKF